MNQGKTQFLNWDLEKLSSICPKNSGKLRKVCFKHVRPNPVQKINMLKIYWAAVKAQFHFGLWEIIGSCFIFLGGGGGGGIFQRAGRGIIF